MKILITGGSGFVGQHLRKTLEKQGHVVATVDVSFQGSDFRCDLRKPEFREFLEELKPSAIVHLAGVQYLHRISRSKRTAFFRQNVEMAEGLSRAILASPSVKSLVYLSTDMVYGRPEFTPVPANSKTNPLGPYGKSKLEVERILLGLSKEAGIRLTVFRPRLIAGQGRKGTIEVLTKLMKMNLPVPVFGKGTNKYQLVSVSDVCSAIALSLEKSSEGIFNLGSDNPPEVRHLISSTIDSLKSRSITMKLPNALLIRLLRFLDHLNLSPLSPEQFEIAGLEYVLDTSETKIALGWEPKKTDFQILLESVS